jgi:subtilisin family serine protease
VSPNTVFPLDESPTNPVTQRVLEHPRVAFDVADDALVVAIRDELLVRASARTGKLTDALQKQASLRATLGDDREGGLADDVEVWRLTDPTANSIDVARRLRDLVPEQRRETLSGPELAPPAVSPNHVCVVSKYNLCPAGPPNPTPPPHDSDEFVWPATGGAQARVVVIDTGYIHTSPPHAGLDARVRSVPGQWLDTSTDPAMWRDCPPDSLDSDHDGRLDGVAGHGTFIAGLIAHRCRECEITVVGQRHSVMELTPSPDPVDEAMLFTDEVSVARSVLQFADADVISCGFAFPTLDGHPSIAFSAVMDVLAGPHAPRRGVAVVAPAGNESSPRPFWPAAHPDVIGVASTNRMGNARAWFSNWGPWADCCARGQDVTSTYIYWHGPVEGEPLTEIETFVGWARWDGTSFAAPKVTAAIAELVAASGGALLPIEAGAQLLAGLGGVAATPLTDMTLWPFPGVPLTHLHLG